ncbi:hypothetical protein GCM10010353_22750 [Streptomyces chryseus]|nr:hypothetical protein GCM10010353_22750 [Streptomyces chryseus]
MWDSYGCVNLSPVGKAWETTRTPQRLFVMLLSCRRTAYRRTTPHQRTANEEDPSHVRDA